jgi:hypothetical protein
MGLYWVFSLFMTHRSDANDCHSARVKVLDKANLTRFGIYTLILIATLAVAGMAVANPLLSTYEYSHYTIRGGSTGLEKAYSQGWSFHPWEIITLVIPSFFGGVGEPYWGWMEFTQIYNYLGVLAVLLAFIAILGKRKRMVTFFTVASVIFLFMSFGRHFNALSDLLLKYLPGFNKFRVPSMILIMLQIFTAILAGYGLKTVLEKHDCDDKRFFKRIRTTLIVMAVLFVLVLLMGKAIFGGLPLASAPELAKYKMNELADVRATRLTIMVNSTLNSLLFVLGGLSLIWLYGKRNVGKVMFLILFTLLVFVDMYRIDSIFLRPENLQPAAEQQTIFENTPTDDFLLQDKGIYRIYPLNVQFGVRYAYNHQVIEGYNGAKLKRYQEVLENCLQAMLQKGQLN